MKRTTRNRPLRPEEAAKYKAIRKQVAEELPDLIARHHKRMGMREERSLENEHRGRGRQG